MVALWLPDKEVAHFDAVRVFRYRTLGILYHISLTAVAFARRSFKAFEDHVELCFFVANLRGRFALEETDDGGV
jgi:hypothetical protein